MRGERRLATPAPRTESKVGIDRWMSWEGGVDLCASTRAGLAAPTSDLGAAIDAVIAANPDKATQYRAGKTGLLGFFVGQVMKATPGADAAAVNKLIRDRLAG